MPRVLSRTTRRGRCSEKTGKGRSRVCIRRVCRRRLARPGRDCTGRHGEDDSDCFRVEEVSFDGIGEIIATALAGSVGPLVLHALLLMF